MAGQFLRQSEAEEPLITVLYPHSDIRITDIAPPRVDGVASPDEVMVTAFAGNRVGDAFTREIQDRTRSRRRRQKLLLCRRSASPASLCQASELGSATSVPEKFVLALDQSRFASRAGARMAPRFDIVALRLRTP